MEHVHVGGSAAISVVGRLALHRHPDAIGRRASDRVASTKSRERREGAAGDDVEAVADAALRPGRAGARRCASRSSPAAWRMKAAFLPTASTQVDVAAPASTIASTTPGQPAAAADVEQRARRRRRRAVAAQRAPPRRGSRGRAGSRIVARVAHRGQVVGARSSARAGRRRRAARSTLARRQRAGRARRAAGDGSASAPSSARGVRRSAQASARDGMRGRAAAQRAVLLQWTSNSEIAAGVTPGRRAACAERRRALRGRASGAPRTRARGPRR